MQQITTYFSQLNGLQQKDIDFVNIYLGIDNPVFLDFNKAFLSGSLVSKEISKHLTAYMNALTNSLFNQKHNITQSLLEGIHESNETYLGLSGFSSNLPAGKSLGPKLKEDVFNNLKEWTDLLRKNPLFDSFHYGIKEIGPDRISDMTISISKIPLINYTVEQCNKHNIPLDHGQFIKYFDFNTCEWKRKSVMLPSYRGKAILFIPKHLVSKYRGLESNFSRFMQKTLKVYFSELPRLKKLVRNSNNIVTPLKKYEFDEAIKKEGTSRKHLSKEAFIEIDNAKMIEIVYDVRKGTSQLLDDELEDLIESSFLFKTVDIVA